MSEDYIADGEIHKLNPHFGVRQAYILKELEHNIDLIQGGEFSEIKDEWLRKIAIYIFQSNKEKFFEILLEHCEDELIDLMKHTLEGGSYRGMRVINHDILNMEMIFRPAHLVSVLAHKATLAIKFDRVAGDEAYFKDGERESLGHTPKE